MAERDLESVASEVRRTRICCGLAILLVAFIYWRHDARLDALEQQQESIVEDPQ